MFNFIRPEFVVTQNPICRMREFAFVTMATESLQSALGLCTA